MLPLYQFEGQRFVLQKDLVLHLKVRRECKHLRHDIERAIRQARLTPKQLFVIQKKTLQAFNQQTGIASGRPLTAITLNGLKKVVSKPGVTLKEKPELQTKPKQAAPSEMLLRHHIVMVFSTLGKQEYYTVEQIVRRFKTVGEVLPSSIEVYDELMTDWFLQEPERTQKSRYIHKFALSNKARRWLRVQLRRQTRG